MGAAAPAYSLRGTKVKPEGLCPSNATTCPGKSEKDSSLSRPTRTRCPPECRTEPSSSTLAALRRPSSPSTTMRPTTVTASSPAVAAYTGQSAVTPCCACSASSNAAMRACRYSTLSSSRSNMKRAFGGTPSATRTSAGASSCMASPASAGGASIASALSVCWMASAAARCVNGDEPPAFIAEAACTAALASTGNGEGVKTAAPPGVSGEPLERADLLRRLLAFAAAGVTTSHVLPCACMPPCAAAFLASARCICSPSCSSSVSLHSS
mmetsp:Transcript_16262/g.50487  ORF Transcript_16262/g.50487 Transcript_16262/m.50487 type:complete len:268 (-) Transcript_16262:199-1002(-)